MMLYAYFFGVSNGVRFAFLRNRANRKSLYEQLGYRTNGTEQDSFVSMTIDLRD